MVLLMWCVCGGLLLHFLEANYLTILLAPNYEKPIDTAQDIIDRKLTIIYAPETESMVNELKNAPAKTDRQLAEMTIVPEVIFPFNILIIILIILNFS